MSSPLGTNPPVPGTASIARLEADIGAIAKQFGVDLVGVADLATAHGFIEEFGGPVLAGFPRAVSLGFRLADGVVDNLHRHEDIRAFNPYRAHYRSVNTQLDQAALLVARAIETTGFRALPLPAAERYDSARLCAVFSHKLAAALAGLGWIGKSCLLVTPEHGPRVRFTTVLTEAPLPAGSPVENGCGDCTVCTENCPAQAIRGRLFHHDEPREMRYDAHACEDYMDRRHKTVGEGLCGLCVHYCPHGRAGRPRSA